MAKKITIDIEVNGKMQKATLSAKKLRNALDGVDEAQTNAGKSARTYDRNTKGAAKTTSNSTKEFSKMAQGMGGLVGAYATVAASVFALSAAFQFFKTAADLSALTAGQEIFASRTGVSMKLMTSNIQDATGGLVAFREAAQAAAIGQAAGLTADQMERLGKVAKNAGTILGRDVTDSFNRLTRGAIKAEPELLDELGIIVRINDAAEAYGRTIGKNAQDLTQFEKSQAVVNAVLEQGESKFDDVGDSVNQVAKFGAAFQDTFKKLSEPVAAIANFIAGALQDSIFAVSAVIGLLGLNIVKAFAPAGPALKNTAEEGISARKRLMDAAQTETDSVTAMKIRQGQFEEGVLKQIERSSKAKSSTVINLSKMEAAAIRRDVAIIRAQNLRMTMEGQGLFKRMITSWRVQMLMFEAEYGKGLGRMKFATAAFASFASRALSIVSFVGIMIMLVELGKQFRQTFLIAPELAKAEKAIENLNETLERQKEAIEEVRGSLRPATSELNKFGQLFGIITNYNLNPVRQNINAITQSLEALDKVNVELVNQDTFDAAARGAGRGGQASQILQDKNIKNYAELEEAIMSANSALETQRQIIDKQAGGVSRISKKWQDLAEVFEGYKETNDTLRELNEIQTRILGYTGNPKPLFRREELKVVGTYMQGLLPSLESLRDLQRDVAKSKLVTPDFNEQSLQALSDLLNETQAYYESGVEVDVLKDKLKELAKAFTDQTEEGQKAVDNAARTKAAFAGVGTAIDGFAEAARKFMPKESDFNGLITALDEVNNNFATIIQNVSGAGSMNLDELITTEGQVSDQESAGVVRALKLVNQLRGEGNELLAENIDLRTLQRVIAIEEEKLLREQFTIERAITDLQIQQQKNLIGLPSFLKGLNSAANKRGEAELAVQQALVKQKNNLTIIQGISEDQKKADQQAVDLAKAKLEVTKQELALQRELAPLLARQALLQTMNQVLNVQKEITSAVAKEQTAINQILDQRMEMARIEVDTQISDQAARDPFFDEAEARANAEVAILSTFERDKRKQIEDNYNLKLQEIDLEYSLLDAKRLLLVQQLKMNASRLNTEERFDEAEALTAAAARLENLNYGPSKEAAIQLAESTRQLEDAKLTKIIRDANRAKEVLNETRQVVMKAGEAFADGLGDAVNGVMDALFDKTKNAADALRETAKGVLTTIRDEMTKRFIVDPAKDFLSGLLGGAKEITPEDIASANQAALQAAKDEVEEQRKKSADIIITAVDDTSAKLIQVFIDGGGIIAKKIKEAIESTTIKIDTTAPERPEGTFGVLKDEEAFKIPVNKVDPIATGNEVLDQITGKPSPVPEAVSEAIENSSSKNEASKVSILNTETKTKVAEDLKRVLEEGGTDLAEKTLKALQDGSISLKDALSIGLDLLKQSGIFGGGGSGSLLGSIFGLGGRYGGVFEQSYAGGGIAKGRQAGYPAVLHGTEAVVPLPNNNKIPVDLRGAAGNQNNITVNVNMETGSSTSEGRQGDPNTGESLGKAIAAAVQTELHNQKRSGGILNPYGVA